MGIEQTIIKFVQELVYFDIFEAGIFLSVFLIDARLKTSKLQFIFHIFMIGILDYLCSNLIIIPGISQLSMCISYSFYIMLVFKTKFKQVFKIIIKIYFLFFIIEVILAIVIKQVFNVELISLSDYNVKFLWMLNFRVIETLLIAIYYKIKKRGEFIYEKSI